MTETKAIEAAMATDLPLTIDLLDWETQARLSERERSRHIAASFRAFSRRLRKALAKVRGRTIAGSTALNR